MFEINKCYNYYNILHLFSFRASLIFVRYLSQLKKYVIYQLFGVIILLQVTGCYTSRSLISNVKNLSSSHLGCFIDDLSDNCFNIANGKTDNSQDAPNTSNNIELEEEQDDCYSYRIYTIGVSEHHLVVSYSINHIEQYSAQYHPDIVPPPPKA
jgi:hypothetical protein